MTIVDVLRETAIADTKRLHELNSRGDNFALQRPVRFHLRAESQQTADAVRDLVNQHHYGSSISETLRGEHVVHVVIMMPIQQQMLLSVSAFMACLAEMFQLRYDGWHCDVQKPN